MDKQKTKYKQTEIGEIPEEWEYKVMDDIGSFKYGYTATSIQENTGIKYIRITDILEDGSIDWQNMPYCKISKEEFEKYKINDGDILFARIGATAGKTCYISHSENVAFASYLIRFQVKKGTNSKFIYYFTQSGLYWSQALRLREGQLKKGLNANTLAEIKIALPPELEQKEIASIFSIIDQRIDIVERERQRIERLKVGVMRELFEGKKWGKVKLAEISEDIFYGITAKASQNSSGIKMLRTTDIKNHTADYNSVPFCEITDKRTDINKHKLEKGDIIVARAGTVGVSVLVDKDYNDIIFGSYLIKVKLKKEVEPRYIHYFFQSSIYWQHIGKAQGSTMLNINLPLLRSLEILLPPLQEQKRIAEILSTLDKKLSIQQNKKSKLETIKKGLMNNLLTGKKRVKVEI